MYKSLRIKAQSVSEYSLLIAIAIIAIIVMNAFVKRGLQGRYLDVADTPTGYIKDVVDKAGVVGDYNIPSQYEPYYEESVTNIKMPGARWVSEKTEEGGGIRKILAAASNTMVDSLSVEKTDEGLEAVP